MDYFEEGELRKGEFLERLSVETPFAPLDLGKWRKVHLYSSSATNRAANKA